MNLQINSLQQRGEPTRGVCPLENFQNLQWNGANLGHPGTFQDNLNHIQKCYFFNKQWEKNRWTLGVFAMHWGLCLTLRVFCLAHGVFALGVFVLHRVFCLALRVFAMHWGLCLTLRVFCLALGVFALHWGPLPCTRAVQGMIKCPSTRACLDPGFESWSQVWIQKSGARSGSRLLDPKNLDPNGSRS